MSTPIRPSTPATPTSNQATPATPSLSTPTTGRWQHPRFEEIARRQAASSFSDKNTKQVGYNLGALVSLYAIGRWLWNVMPNFFHAGKVLHPFATWTYHILQVIFVYNIIVALWPLFRAKDDLSDIALTPAQRHLLGLAPTSKPPTPGSQYVTPPRYARTATPMSGSPASKTGSFSNSPLSGSPIQGVRSGSPFSPSASPLLQKAVGGAGKNGSKRHSFGSGSPLGMSSSRMSLSDAPATPSPTNPKGASVGLNNRWLYEKGRRTSSNPRLYA